jgi:hypothetical protein
MSSMSPASAVTPYTLVVTACDAGFFSHVNRVVNHLRHSLGRDGCAAVRVDWRSSKDAPLFVYGTPQDGELWQRFFEPLAFPHAPALERTTWHYADLSMTGLHAYRMYKGGAGWRTAYGRVYERHVHIRAELRRRVDELWRAGGGADGGRCVGVHYRHVAHDHECPRSAPTLETFIARTRGLLGASDGDRIVLATDVREAVDAFRAEFGERLLVQPGVARARAGGDQHDSGAPPSVALGEQALVDALLLARCDVLLHTTSNLATAVGYMSPRLQMVYCEPRLAGLAATVRARLSPPRRATEVGISRRPYVPPS